VPPRAAVRFRPMPLLVVKKREEWHARRDSNPRLSDPKSEGAGSEESSQLLAEQGTCGVLGDGGESCLGGLLGVSGIRDPDLATLVASWEKLPEHVRTTIRTVLHAARRP